MKKFEKLAVILLCLWVVTLIPNPGMKLLASKLYGQTDQMQMKAWMNAYVLVQAVLMFAVKLGIGVWLFIAAKKRDDSGWIWMLLGWAFGIPAAILYYLMRILERLEAIPDPQREDN